MCMFKKTSFFERYFAAIRHVLGSLSIIYVNLAK